MHFAYILKSLRDNSYYIGCSANPKRRLKYHNLGRSKYTKNKRPWKLVYIEKFSNRAEAYKREKKIKAMKKRRYIEEVIAGEKIGTIAS